MTGCSACNNTGRVPSAIDNETYTCPRCKGKSPLGRTNSSAIKYDGMSNLELANNIADNWLATNPGAAQGCRWRAIRDRALEIITYLRPEEGK